MGNCLTALCFFSHALQELGRDGQGYGQTGENFSRVCKINTLKITFMSFLWLDKINFIGVFFTCRKSPQWRSKREMQTPPGSCAEHMGLQFSPRASPFHIPQEVQQGESPPLLSQWKFQWCQRGGDLKLCWNGSTEDSFVLAFLASCFSCCRSYPFLIYPTSYLGWRTFPVSSDIFCFF